MRHVPENAPEPAFSASKRSCPAIRNIEIGHDGDTIKGGDNVAVGVHENASINVGANGLVFGHDGDTIAAGANAGVYVADSDTVTSSCCPP